MLWLRRLHLRRRSLFNRDAVEDELNRELAFHLAQLKAENMAAGMTEREAEHAARRAFGSDASLAEQCRDERRTRWIEDAVQDIRFALRTFAASPGFTAVAILTLALGIGATAAFFTTTYGILFRPLPYREPDRLIEVEYGPAGVGPVTAMRELSKAVEYGGYQPGNELDLQTGGELRRVEATAVTWNLARVLGVHPSRGRWFEQGDERPGQHRVVVLSDRTWRERFHADPAIVGRRILINEDSFQIVGVMPPEFAFPSRSTELWFPVRIDPRNPGYLWGSGNLRPVGRLHPGMTVEAAQAEMRPLIRRILPMFPWRMPDEYAVDAHVIPIGDAAASLVKPRLFALAAGSLLLLLIACGNVANLLLARAVGRSREIAMREALGAGGGRLLRQLLTENLTLCLAGGLAGVATALAILALAPACSSRPTHRGSTRLASVPRCSSLPHWR